MFVSLIVRWAVLAATFALTSWILSGMTINGGFWSVLWVSLIFGIVNVLIGTIVRILTLPLTILTLGLFAIVINALLLELTDWITDRLTIDDFFWTAILAAIIMAIVGMVLDVVVRSIWRPARAASA
jgi:putative membrane protein